MVVMRRAAAGAGGDGGGGAVGARAAGRDDARATGHAGTVRVMVMAVVVVMIVVVIMIAVAARGRGRLGGRLGVGRAVGVERGLRHAGRAVPVVLVRLARSRGRGGRRRRRRLGGHESRLTQQDVSERLDLHYDKLIERMEWSSVKGRSKTTDCIGPTGGFYTCGQNPAPPVLLVNYVFLLNPDRAAPGTPRFFVWKR